MSDSKPYEIRASLLHLAKDIISENAHMHFESTKAGGNPVWNAVTTDQILAEAEKLYSFVSRKQ